MAGPPQPAGPCGPRGSLGRRNPALCSRRPRTHILLVLSAFPATDTCQERGLLPGQGQTSPALRTQGRWLTRELVREGELCVLAPSPSPPPGGMALCPKPPEADSVGARTRGGICPQASKVTGDLNSWTHIHLYPLTKHTKHKQAAGWRRDHHRPCPGVSDRGAHGECPRTGHLGIAGSVTGAVPTGS